MKRTLLLAAGAALLAGCGGNDAGMTVPQPTGGMGLNSPAQAAKLDPRTESKMVTKEAATLKFDALKAEVIVPKEAVADTAKVIGQIPVDIKDLTGLVPGTLMEFTAPKFAKPVELTVKKPKKKGDLSLVQYVEKKWVATKATLDEKKGLFHLTTDTLGTYAVAVKPATKKVEPPKALKAVPTKAKVKIPKLGL